MSQVEGQLVGLRASEKAQLERFLDHRIKGSDFVSIELARKLSKMSFSIGRQLALLVDRSGQIVSLVVGSKDRVYLPDLGRYRLDAGRLRRLRLIVFAPLAEERFERRPVEVIPYGVSSQQTQSSDIKWALTPPVAQDLLTDLEKLRLDALLIVGVNSKGEPAGVALGFIDPAKTSRGNLLQRNSISLVFRPDLAGLNISFLEFVAEIEELIVARVPKTKVVGATSAVLVGAYSGQSLAECEASMSELEELARTAGVEVADIVIQRRPKLDPRTVLGKGKIEDLMLHCLDLGAELVIFDRELSPGQLRSVTNLTELKVLDRSMLILDIFAQRAKSSEGRLQVELAQLRYSLPRLTERDTGLSRLSGGIGGRGPGETKLEIGRRRARDRIADLEKRIGKVADQRSLRRERRQQRGVPVVAIVGYTNAGKSTLLNALTKGDVFVENKLFATLDTSSRRMRFPNEREVIFVDTVGFIRELPKELVAAFKSTLEEVAEADVLLHVVDASNADSRKQISVVEQTLNSLGYSDIPSILVWNKCDLLSDIELRGLQSVRAKEVEESTSGLSDYEGYPSSGLRVSATTRLGFEELIRSLQQLLLQTFAGQDPGRFTEIDSLP